MAEQCLTSIGAQCMDILKHICFQLHNSFLLHRLFVLHERSNATETFKFKIKILHTYNGTELPVFSNSIQTAPITL